MNLKQNIGRWYKMWFVKNPVFCFNIFAKEIFSHISTQSTRKYQIFVLVFNSSPKFIDFQITFYLFVVVSVRYFIATDKKVKCTNLYLDFLEWVLSLFLYKYIALLKSILLKLQNKLNVLTEGKYHQTCIHTILENFKIKVIQKHR